MTSENPNKESINITCSENDDGETEPTYNINVDIVNFLQEFEKISKKKTSNNVMDHSELYAEISNYDINFSIKQLTMICEYYGIRNLIKGKKKTDVIENIMIYENNPDNIIMVLKRKQLWYYMDEIKSDKFLKKYIINW
uniref:Uncharacterized protein n=1 Tax=viral metagenome TaxID=1070528 RepID=A0A6C0KXB9_9ZZZZ